MRVPFRITFLCFGLESEQLHKQPWHSVLGIASGLLAHGFNISIVTDARNPPQTTPFKIITVKHLFQNNQPSQALTKALQALQPDRIVATAGTQELLRPTRFRLSTPVTLLLANQRFNYSELKRISVSDWVREWCMLKLPLIQSVLPGGVLRHGLRKSGVTHLAYISQAAQKRHAQTGLPPGSLILPRVKATFLDCNYKATRQNNEKIFCYFGSPLSLRGAEDVVGAFVASLKQGMTARLKLYMRVDDDIVKMRTRNFEQYIKKKFEQYWGSIEYSDRHLSAESLAALMQEIDIFVLPFKITVSDAPLVILEAALSGKPVITLDTPGISEWQTKFPNIIISRLHAMGKTMLETAESFPPQIDIDTAPWGDWKLATTQFSQTINHPLDISALKRFRMICLIGPDGCGKTTLLNHLSEQLGMQSCPHGYIWSRFRNYLSKPLLGLLRLTGHNRKEIRKGIRIGIHNFSHIPLISSLFLLLQKWDMRLDIHLRYRPLLKQGLLLSDRCLLDTLVDLAVDTGMKNYILGNYGKNLLAKLPQPTLVVMITRNTDIVLHDRPDVAADQDYAKRLTLYSNLAETFAIPILHNDCNIDESLKRLCLIAQEITDA